MKLVESLRLALSSLRLNKLRSALTMLGIVIGVAAVIALVSVGEGVQDMVSTQIQGIGSNLLFVFSGRCIITGNFWIHGIENKGVGIRKAEGGSGKAEWWRQRELSSRQKTERAKQKSDLARKMPAFGGHNIKCERQTMRSSRLALRKP